MEKATWKRSQELSEKALELRVEQRDSYLQQHAQSGTLAQEVRDLVDAHLRCSSLWQGSPTVSTEWKPDFHHAVTLESGHVIGPYRIEDNITSGGMGIIYRALDTRLQR